MKYYVKQSMPALEAAGIKVWLVCELGTDRQVAVCNHANDASRVAFALNSSVTGGVMKCQCEHVKHIGLKGCENEATEERNTVMGTYQVCATCDCMPAKPPCGMCVELSTGGFGPGFGPRHEGSPNCKSGSLASGGTSSHCTCDTCF